MIIKSIWLRRIHKWVGIFIGLQFLLWAISGTAMALLDMGEVAGGERADRATPGLAASTAAWPRIQGTLAGRPVTKVSLQPLPWGQALQVMTADGGVQLFNLVNGAPVMIGAREAGMIAAYAHPGGAKIASAKPLQSLTLPVREHDLPIWQIDFSDDQHSSYYISGSTGAILERRNDAWRWWDFFWMLHNMDYAERTSLNHPLIITVGLTMAWLAVTGFWLLFRTMWRHDFAWARTAKRASFTRGTR